MKEKIVEMLEQIKPNADFVNATKLIDEKVLDSFDVVMLVGELNTAFDVEVTMEYLLPENFNSVEAMVQLIEKLQN